MRHKSTRSELPLSIRMGEISMMAGIEEVAERVETLEKQKEELSMKFEKEHSERLKERKRLTKALQKLKLIKEKLGKAVEDLPEESTD